MEGVEHIAFVMDGNGRWAESQGFPRSMGHKAGSEVIRDVVKMANRLKVRFVTLFGLSCDNFYKRPKAEVSYLMELMGSCLDEYLEEMVSQGVRLSFIGDIDQLGEKISKKIYAAMKASSHNEKLVLTVAVNFSGHWHIVQTTKLLLEKTLKFRKMPSEKEIEDSYQSLLPSSPDILIRTGGNARLSDFVMYHLGYTELFFLDVKWPDFREHHLLEVLNQYHNTERRFGGLEVT